MEKKNVLTKILAIVGTALVWVPILAPVLFSVVSMISDRLVRFDYLMPAELFPLALTGGLLLLWAALRARSQRKLIVWGLGAAVAFLFFGQALAVVTGLVSGEVEPSGWRMGIVLGMIVAYALAIIAVGVGGILLLRQLFRNSRQVGTPLAYGHPPISNPEMGGEKEKGAHPPISDPAMGGERKRSASPTSDPAMGGERKRSASTSKRLTCVRFLPILNQYNMGPDKLQERLKLEERMIKNKSRQPLLSILVLVLITSLACEAPVFLQPGGSVLAPMVFQGKGTHTWSYNNGGQICPTEDDMTLTIDAQGTDMSRDGAVILVSEGRCMYIQGIQNYTCYELHPGERCGIRIGGFYNLASDQITFTACALTLDTPEKATGSAKMVNGVMTGEVRCEDAESFQFALPEVK
jgi:hypothetical protein